MTMMTTIMMMITMPQTHNTQHTTHTQQTTKMSTGLKRRNLGEDGEAVELPEDKVIPQSNCQTKFLDATFTQNNTSPGGRRRR